MSQDLPAIEPNDAGREAFEKSRLEVIEAIKNVTVEQAQTGLASMAEVFEKADYDEIVEQYNALLKELGEFDLSNIPELQSEDDQTALFAGLNLMETPVEVEPVSPEVHVDHALLAKEIIAQSAVPTPPGTLTGLRQILKEIRVDRDMDESTRAYLVRAENKLDRILDLLSAEDE